jgi:Asp-tRNA(Asn)/Glu-tRNA(Gln) amidotransferase A subunit family amidase
VSTDAIEAAIAAYDEWEPQLRAFAWFDRDAVQAAAAVARPGGVLAGVPVGVKDVFDTAAIPTEYGTPVFAGRVPARSAVAVERIEAAGGVVFGKTVTAELAYYEPGPTTNPYDPGRTPGGSSMGSAAVVAAGIVPVALGSQTNGSLVRPAAFCGVVAFKPSAGRLPREGVLAFSPSLDQGGAFGRTVAEATRVCAVLAGEAESEWLPSAASARPPVLGLVRTPEWDRATPAMRSRFHAVAVEAGAAGASVVGLEMPASLAGAIATHRTIMAVEANRSLRPLVAERLGELSVQFRQLLDEGAGRDPAAYQAALADQVTLRGEFTMWTSEVDALLTLSTLGEAPPIVTTGDPVCCTRWTLVGAPVFSVPCGLAPDGLPLAVQLVGRPGRDRELAGVAGWLEALLGPIAAPPRPRATSPHG